MTPSGWPRSLLTHAVADDAAGLSIIGDLDQEFQERCARDGVGAARRWYWRQAIAMWCWSAWTHPHRSHHQPRGDAMFDLVGDIRHAVRIAVKSPGQTALIVGTLALAIGSTTVGFSFADTAILRGLPVAEPDQTVIVYGTNTREPDRRGGVFLSDFLDLRERARSVERLSSWMQARATLVRPGADPMRITVIRVSGDLFAVWGLRIHLGRALRPGDDSPGAPRVAVLTDRFWRETFGSTPMAVGETVMIDGVPYAIVGVLTSGIEFGAFASIGMWVSHPIDRSESRDVQPVMVTGRLAEGATVEGAAAEFRTIAQSLEAEHPETNRGRGTLVLAVNRAVGGPNLYLVMTLLVGAAALVTAIASVNIAGILLARAVVRQREFGLRIALGARKVRVFRQLAAEGALLALLGGAGGLLVAELGLRFIRSVDAEPIFQQIVIDWHEVLFVATLAVVAPLLFSLAPALAALRVNLVGVLNAGGSRAVGSGGRMRAGLVAAQVALAVSLAIVAGLVARTLTALVWAPNGFESSNVVRFVLALDQHSSDRAVRRQVMRGVAEGLASAEHMAVGALDVLPAAMIETTSAIEPDGVSAPSGRAEHWAHIVAVDHNALLTLAVPLLEGRLFTATEIEGDVEVALLSGESARRYFGGPRPALGRRVVIRQGTTSKTYQIVGVTGDVRNTDPEDGTPPRVWVPLSDPRAVAFVVRTSGDVASVAISARRVARELVPGVPIESLETYDQSIRRQTGGNRVAMGMLISFAAMAVAFAAVGLYGTVALSANMRRAEFATRFALGAQTRDVAGLVLAQAFTLLVIGLVPGLAGGLLAAVAMRRLLYGVTPLDPLNLVGVVGLLIIVGLAASVAPVLRAARLNVIEAIRTE
jgi:putative ABC transport system permease protein